MRERERERQEERDKQQKMDSEIVNGGRHTQRERENIEIWEVTLSIRLAGHQSSSGFSSQTGKELGSCPSSLLSPPSLF